MNCYRNAQQPSNGAHGANACTFQHGRTLRELLLPSLFLRPPRLGRPVSAFRPQLFLEMLLVLRLLSEHPLDDLVPSPVFF